MARCRPWLYGRAAKNLPRRLAGKEDTSDLVQNGLIQAAKGIGRFQGRSISEFYAWMARILDRQILKALRRWRYRRRDLGREQPLGPARSDTAELAASSTPVLERLSQEEEWDRLMLAASWCREEDTAVIFLHLFQDRTHEQIAAELGISPLAVRKRYSRAVRRVREATQLQALMTDCGFRIEQQDVIGVHRFQRAEPAQIAERLRMPEELVARWIAEAQPLLHALARDGS
jgi:RNA polymerase sigma-70 factor (ECF subfamily)